MYRDKGGSIARKISASASGPASTAPNALVTALPFLGGDWRGRSLRSQCGRGFARARPRACLCATDRSDRLARPTGRRRLV